MVSIWQDGYDEIGDDLAVSPLYNSGTTWFVGPYGNDAYDGGTKAGALGNFTTALAMSAAGDTIVLLPGYAAVHVAPVDVTLDDLTIIGCGSSGGAPSCFFGYNAAAGVPWTISGNRVKIVNVKFTARAQLNNTATIDVTGNDVWLRGCHVDCGPFDTIGLDINITPYTVGDYSTATLEDCVITSTATSPAARSVNGVRHNCIVPARLVMTGCTVDGGAVNWSGYAVDIIAFAGANGRVRIEQLSLLRGAELALNSSVDGIVSVAQTSDGGRVRW